MQTSKNKTIEFPLVLFIILATIMTSYFMSSKLFKNEAGDQSENVDTSEVDDITNENKTELEVESDLVLQKITDAVSDNCTISFGRLMLINPNFPGGTDFIYERKWELISLYDNYGIMEGNC